MTFSTALSLSFDDKVREADFVAFYSDSKFDGSTEPYLLFGEAKSLGAGELLNSSDIEHMKDIGEKFPGSILVFALLRDHFTEKEKRLLRKVVRWGRRLDKQGNPSNRILLLTSNELFATFGSISHVWKKLGEPHAKFSEYNYTSSLRNLADATVEIHLGMPSFWEERRAAWGKRKKTKDEKAKHELPPGAQVGHMLVSINEE